MMTGRQRIRVLWRRLGRALGCAALAAAVPAAVAQADVPDASPAERLVFLQPHLANIQPPRQLRYEFVHEGGTEGRLADRMTLELTAGAGGACCAVRGSFLAGARALSLPDIPDARSNPALLYYLEYEVRELQRKTRGQSAHFRKRIRQALVNGAQVSPTTVRWAGREVPAQAVRITPFVDDPYRARFERDAAKEYTFVLSEHVPGGVFQVQAVLPGTPLRDTLTLEGSGDTPPPTKVTP
jgi:hypothetical protein